MSNEYRDWLRDNAWDAFLSVRANLIDHLKLEGHDYKSIAQIISCDDKQVESIHKRKES